MVLRRYGLVVLSDVLEVEELLMAIKTYHLIKLEELGILFQYKGGWYVSAGLDGVDIQDALFSAGMFEH